MVYPPDGVLIPPNLTMLEVQFTPPAGTTLFELSFVGPALDLKIYTTVRRRRQRLRLLPDEDDLEAPEPRLGVDDGGPRPAPSSPSGRGRGGGAQALVRRRGPLGRPRTIGRRRRARSIATTSACASRRPRSSYTAQQSGSTCVGCHVLSRNGQRIAVGMNVPGPAQLRTLDVATRATLFDSARWRRLPRQPRRRQRLQLRGALARWHARAGQQRRQPRARSIRPTACRSAARS